MVSVQVCVLLDVGNGRSYDFGVSVLEVTEVAASAAYTHGMSVLDGKEPVEYDGSGASDDGSTAEAVKVSSAIVAPSTVLLGAMLAIW